MQSCGSSIYDNMLIFNREHEEIRKAREKKEREWQEELERSMNMSDPTGQGKMTTLNQDKFCNFMSFSTYLFSVFKNNKTKSITK